MSHSVSGRHGDHPRPEMAMIHEIRDPLLSPPRLPWAAAVVVGLSLGGAAGLAAARLFGVEAGAGAGLLAFALSTAYLLGRPVLAWARARAELERRLASLHRDGRGGG